MYYNRYYVVETCIVPPVPVAEPVTVPIIVEETRPNSGSPALSVPWPRESRQAAFRTPARNNTHPARPYICRLIVFSRFTCPSTGPLLHLCVTAA
jgi:hypothetical protein